MRRILLSDRLFQVATRRADDAGFTNVDDYIADVLRKEFDEETAALNALFTPQRLAQIDRAAAQIDAGRGMTRGQVEAELARSRTEWLDQNRR